MDYTELLSEVKDAISVKRVYGDPIEKDGMTVIPVASVRGGGGGGGGTGGGGKDDTGGGSGSGFGVSARPVGVYVIKDGDVVWRPAFDLGRTILLGQLTGIALILTLRSMSKSRGKTKRVKLKS